MVLPRRGDPTQSLRQRAVERSPRAHQRLPRGPPPLVPLAVDVLPFPPFDLIARHRERHQPVRVPHALQPLEPRRPEPRPVRRHGLVSHGSRVDAIGVVLFFFPSHADGPRDLRVAPRDEAVGRGAVPPARVRRGQVHQTRAARRLRVETDRWKRAGVQRALGEKLHARFIREVAHGSHQRAPTPAPGPRHPLQRGGGEALQCLRPEQVGRDG